MPRKTETKNISFGVPPDKYDLVAAAAEQAGMNLADYVRAAIAEKMTRQGAPISPQELSPAPVGWVKGRSRKTGKEKESEALPEGQIRQAIGLRGRIATMPPGAVAGIFAPVAPSDTQRITADQPYQVVNWDMWVYGLHVQGFSMMGRFPFEIGDWIDFSAFGSDAARRVRILEIRQVNGDALTSDDLSLLGYGREEWEAEGVPLRRGWLMRVQVEKEIEGKRPTGEPTIIHEDGKVERITPTDSIDD